MKPQPRSTEQIEKFEDLDAQAVEEQAADTVKGGIESMSMPKNVVGIVFEDGLTKPESIVFQDGLLKPKF